MRLQQRFIEWVADEVPGEIPTYLGGASAENVTSCWKVSRTEGLMEVGSLQNDHEEADDRMMYHVNQAVNRHQFQRVVIASADRCVCVLFIPLQSMEIWWFRGDVDH